MDPKARQLALAIGAGRVAMGAAILLATRPTVRRMGFGSTDASGEALAKLGGGRDVALVAALLDAADAAAFSFAAVEPETRRGGAIGVLAGGAAALLGFWAWRRLA